MSSQEIQNEVKAIVARKLDLPVDKIEMDIDLKYGIGADSLTITEIILALEEKFNVDLEDVDFIFEDLTINRIVQIIEGQLQPV